MQLPLEGACALLLAAHRLAAPTPRVGKQAVRDAIQRMGALQIETIHVVARSQLLVLRSRLGAFKPAWLDELLAEGDLFEYWSHAACLPLSLDFVALDRPSMLCRRVRSTREGWLAEHTGVAGRVPPKVRGDTPACTADWQRTDGRTGQW